MNVLNWCLAYLVLTTVNSLPIDEDGALSYLQNFGYLPKASAITSRMQSYESLETAIKQLQRIGNIPVTGEIDSDTVELLQKPRCGVTDTNLINKLSTRLRRYTTIGSPWDKKNVTWFFINRNQKGVEDVLKIKKLISDAFGFWTENSNLSIKEGDDERADILIDFSIKEHGDRNSFDGKSGTLAHAFPPGTGLGGDAHFDEEEDWNYVDFNMRASGTSFFFVALHEFGHSLGLGHASLNTSIMFPWYWVYNLEKNVLPDDDRIGIEFLYGKNNRKTPATFIPTSTVRSTNQTPITTTTVRSTNQAPITTTVRSTNQAPITTTTVRSTNQAPITTTTLRSTNQTPITTTTSKTTHPTLSTRRPPPSKKPDTCNTGYDAIMTIRSDVFIFKGRYMWRIKNGVVMAGYPSEIQNMWSEFPEASFTHINAGFENYKQNEIWFFVGVKLYIFAGSRLVTVRTLTDIGLDVSVKKIDAIFTWGPKNVTYIFGGDNFWRMDENFLTIEPNYPKNITGVWRNVEDIDMDTGFQRDGRTYFFKGRVFYEFDYKTMTLNLAHPRMSSQFWMNCPPNVADAQKISLLSKIATNWKKH